MTQNDSTNPSETRIAEDAAEWFVEFSTGEPDLAARTEFDKWLRMSPEHLRAYLDMVPVWDDAGLPGIAGTLSTEELIARSRSSANVVPLELNGSPERTPTEEVPRSGGTQAQTPRGVLIAAASVLVACIAAAMLWWQSEREPAFSTDIGEQRSIALADGSTVELNSRSRIRVRFTSAERVVDLLEGQALFQVASDPNHPFIVRSDTARVRAVGTQFDVYRRASGTTVTVLEGRVAVLGSRALELAAGEQVTVTPTAVQRPSAADVTAATAWRQRELVFNATPLVQVAEEFNRYNKRRLTIGNSGLADFHITGVFSSTDPTSLLRFLRLQPGIRVQEFEGEIRISAQ